MSDSKNSLKSIPVRDWVLLLLVLAWALLLRGSLVPSESPWFDEVITLRYLDAPSLPVFFDLVEKGNSPVQPLYLIAEFMWAKIFGSAPVAQRWLSIIFSEFSLVLIFLIGHRLQGATTGLLAALALASSAVHLQYSLEIRMYMLTFVWALASVYSLLRLMDKPTSAWWAAHLLCTLGLVWTHAFGVFLLPVEAIAWFYWGPKNLKSKVFWIVGQGLAAGSLVFWLVQADFETIEASMAWLPQPTFWPGEFPFAGSVLGTWFMWLASSDYREGLFNVSNCVSLVVFVGLSIAAITVSAVRIRRNIPAQNGIQSSGIVLWLAAWWIVPPLLIYGLSYAWQPTFYPRYVLYSMAAPFLLSAWAIAQITTPRWKIAAVATMIMLSLSMGLLNTRKPFRAPWAAVLSEMDRSKFIVYNKDQFKMAAAVHTIRFFDFQNRTRYRPVGVFENLEGTINDTSFPHSLNVILVGSTSLKSLDDFIEEKNIQVTVHHYPACVPLTRYELSAKNFIRVRGLRRPEVSGDE